MSCKLARIGSCSYPRTGIQKVKLSLKKWRWVRRRLSLLSTTNNSPHIGKLSQATLETTRFLSDSKMLRELPQSRVYKSVLFRAALRIPLLPVSTLSKLCSLLCRTHSTRLSSKRPTLLTGTGSTNSFRRKANSQCLDTK